MSALERTAAIIVSAGRGHRYGGETPKQYLTLGGRSVLYHAAKKFLDHPDVDDVCVVIHPDDRHLYDEAVEGLDLSAPVLGGAERQDSVRAGLQHLVASPPERVIIHDAVRPLVSDQIINDVLNNIGPNQAALPSLPVTDTLKRQLDGKIVETIDRSMLVRAQTPQGFMFEEVLAAHEKFMDAKLTDDTALAEAAGMTVKIVPGSEDNLKITTAGDLRRLGQLLAGDTGMARVGTGFDVHRFMPGDHVMICGVKVPHDAALEGHSDADVGLHAITDALLGAAGLGDIGQHFPPSDERWHGASSDLFLAHAASLITGAGGSIANVDVTVICERPKIGRYRDEMRERVAEILALPVDRVNIKGTTTERLGFTGRGEGIAAQAAASVIF